MTVRKILLLLCYHGLQALPQNSVISQINSVQSGQKQFTTSLIKELESSTSTNFVLSPYSLHSVFSQLLHGAGGRSKTELEAVLGVQQSNSLIDQYKSLGEGLASGVATVKDANLIALGQGFKPNSGYTNDLLRGFNSDIREYDFGAGKANSVREINDFVAQKTNQKIEDLLDNKDVDASTVMVLINAVYFKDNWKFAFDPENTFTHTFRSPSGDITTNYLNRQAEVRVLEDRERQLDILELPYNDPNKAMLIVLPKEEVSTDNIMERMEGINLGDLRTQGRLADTSIFIPKFKLRFQTYLKEKMEKLGAGHVFSPQADLSGISSSPLYASEGVHQAFIEVNEEGTEAAAATAVVVGLRTASQRRQFFADRPFLFMVYDFQNDVTLFAGKVVDPSSDTVIQRRASLTQEQIGTTTQASQFLQPQQGSIVPQSVTRGDPEVCSKLFRDFPNSRDNSQICQKVEATGKRLDWLRNNRALCEQSQDFFNNFMANSCSDLWCQEAAQLVDSWRLEADSVRCSDNAVETPEIKQMCKNVRNKLKAVTFLNCNI